MHAPTFVETSTIVRREREQELRNHQRHLKEILSRSKRLDLSPVRIRPKPDGFQQAARQVAILRENKALFERLLAISQGKWSPFPISSQRLTPKSLNGVSRMREVRKITEENSLMADRLVNKTGLMSTKKTLKEYEEMRRYRDQISKAAFFTESKRREKGKDEHSLSTRVTPTQSLSEQRDKRQSVTPIASSNR